MSDEIPTIVLDGSSNAAPKAEHLKLHASLTTRDSEDWIVVPNKNRVLIVAFRETRFNGTAVTWSSNGWSHRTAMLRRLERLPVKHNLGVVSVYVATDAAEQGTSKLLSTLHALGKRKAFNVLSTIVTGADTEQCLRCLAPASQRSQDFATAPIVMVALN